MLCHLSMLAEWSSPSHIHYRTRVDSLTRKVSLKLTHYPKVTPNSSRLNELVYPS